jgi:hypothetical protein
MTSRESYRFHPLFHPPAPGPPRRAANHARARQDGLLARVGYVEELVAPRTKPGKTRLGARAVDG